MEPSDGGPKEAWYKKWWGIGLMIGLIGFGGLVLVAAIFGGEVDSTATDAPTPSETTAAPSAEPTEEPTEEPPAEEPAPAVTVTVTATPTEVTEPAVEAEEEAPAPDPTPEEAKVVKVKVPDAIGKNYQLAQDMWRAKGLIVMPAKDALGLDRLAWLDSNWVVVGQSPKPGSRVKEGAEIRATIKKYTD